jgi:hypothetical protein
MRPWPKIAVEPAVGACRSAVAVHVASPDIVIDAIAGENNAGENLGYVWPAETWNFNSP